MTSFWLHWHQSRQWLVVDGGVKTFVAEGIYPLRRIKKCIKIVMHMIHLASAAPTDDRTNIKNKWGQNCFFGWFVFLSSCSPGQQRLRRGRGSVQGVDSQAGDAAGPHAGWQSCTPLAVAQGQALGPGAVERGGVGVPGERLGKKCPIVSNLVRTWTRWRQEGMESVFNKYIHLLWMRAAP